MYCELSLKQTFLQPGLAVRLKESLDKDKQVKISQNQSWNYVNLTSASALRDLTVHACMK